MQFALQTSGRPTSGRPTITALYSEFEAAHIAFFSYQQELDSAQPDCNFDSSWHRKFQRTVGVCNKIALRLSRTPATTLQEIMLKLRVVAWLESDIKYDTLEDLDRWRARWKPAPETEEALHILAELQEDLHRVAGR